MQFDLNDFSREVYAVSVAHGWHDPEPTPAETIALIHSEWSEALQAYRNKEPMYEYWQADSRPDGIAVELIDGCLRILDNFGFRNARRQWNTSFRTEAKNVTLPYLVTMLHSETSDAFKYAEIEGNDGFNMLGGVFEIVFVWLSANGIDPYQVMKEKHEYNKTRPYRHGGKKL